MKRNSGRDDERYILGSEHDFGAGALRVAASAGAAPVALYQSTRSASRGAGAFARSRIIASTSSASRGTHEIHSSPFSVTM
jgi:hypothetical protein